MNASIKTQGPAGRRLGRLLPWLVAAVAGLVAVIAIGMVIASQSNASSASRPVAQLTAQGTPAEGSIRPDDETAVDYGLTPADFTSYGSYGVLEIWGTTQVSDKRCIAVVVESHISVFDCAAPSLDTIADFDIDPSRVPRAPSGELTANVRFVLHDDVVDVYLAPNPEGGYY